MPPKRMARAFNADSGTVTFYRSDNLAKIVKGIPPDGLLLTSCVVVEKLATITEGVI
jgi:hypothetical protein